ncbi:MAG TPA: hypothetical protein VMA72_00720 [Streptosporangiaceae bacterium]|nr:hypothetical protein [Streptosporangiaceae bacterium]
MLSTRPAESPVASSTSFSRAVMAQAVKVVARAHKTLIWERTRHTQRLRHQLRDYFPAALEAYEDLDAPDTLELLAKAPDPASAARLTTAQIDAALKRARRHNRAEKTAAIKAALRGEQLASPPQVTAACAAVVRALAGVLTALNEQITVLEGQVDAHFSPHSSAMTRTGMPRRRPARTTRPPARSPASPAKRRPSRPGTCTTTGSAMPSTARPSLH